MSASLPLPLSAFARVGRLRRFWAEPDVAWCPSWCRQGRTGFWLGLNLGVLLGYFGLGCAVGRFFASFGLFPAPIWLPAGLAVVAAMLGGWRLASSSALSW